MSKERANPIGDFTDGVGAPADHSVAAAGVQVERIPDAELRSRVRQNAFFVLLSPPDDMRSTMERRQATLWLCMDSIETLGAYLRDDPPPERNSTVKDLRVRFAEFLDSTFFLEGGEE
ncbi:hypothetical protein ACWD7F_26190 [Streptomyces sp. NPDC005122]